MRRVDVIVVGGGIIGCAIARELSASHRVLLLERSRIGGEASSAAAGILGVQCESDNEVVLRLGVESRRLFPDWISMLREETGAEVEMGRRGTLALCFRGDDVTPLKDRERWQAAAGITCETLTAREVRRLEPRVGPRIIAARLYTADTYVDPIGFTNACAEAARRRGACVEEGSAVRRLVCDQQRVTGVETVKGVVHADVVINAAGAWSPELSPPDLLPIGAVRGQMVSVRATRRLLEHVLYSETGYVVPRKDGRLLFGSTREEVGFEPGVTAGGIDQILRAAFRLVPAARDLPIEAMWSGFRPATPDGVPIIGAHPTLAGYILATGHFRNGVLLAPITAQCIAALLRGESIPHAEQLSPGRTFT